MELVEGIVTANDDMHSPTNPASYSDPERPGKEVTDAGLREGEVVLLGSLNADNTSNERVKTDGTFGDVSIATVTGNADPAA